MLKPVTATDACCPSQLQAPLLLPLLVLVVAPDSYATWRQVAGCSALGPALALWMALWL